MQELKTGRTAKAVQDAMLCTPIHPDGIDGAVVQAAAVAALSLSTPAGESQQCPFFESQLADLEEAS